MGKHIENLRLREVAFGVFFSGCLCACYFYFFQSYVCDDDETKNSEGVDDI